MTKKELEELVKKQAEQISELISLVQKKEKEVVIVKDSQTKPWVPSPVSPWPTSPSYPWTPTSPINPWVTYCGTGTGNYTSSSSTGSPLPDDFKDKPFNDFGDGKFETWDKEPEMIKAWDKLGIIGHNKSEDIV